MPIQFERLVSSRGRARKRGWKFFLVSVSAAIVLRASPALAAEHDLAPFPEAEDGYVRAVIRLEPRPDENDLRLELMVGREMEVDCNRLTLGGEITEGTVTGWGYPYYRVEVTGANPSTLMACPPGSAKRIEFVRVADRNPLRRYNSRLPVVVYVPREIEVRYRVWMAGALTGRATAE